MSIKVWYGRKKLKFAKLFEAFAKFFEALRSCEATKLPSKFDAPIILRKRHVFITAY